MTTEEQRLLNGLIDRVRNTPPQAHDAEAAELIHSTLGTDANALYVLCQTVLVQNYALDQAQKQIADLKQQASAAQAGSQGQGHGGFLDRIFGDHRPQTAAPPPQPGYAQQPQYGQPQYGQPVYGQPPAYIQQPNMPPPAMGYNIGGMAPAGGMIQPGGGFLQSAMQVAAGVAVGELAVQGIEGLMHGFGEHAGYGSDREMGSFGRDFEGAEHGERFSDPGSSAFGSEVDSHAGDPVDPDIEDRRGFAHAGGDGTDATGDSMMDDDMTDDNMTDDGTTDDSDDFSSSDDSN